MKIEHLAIWVHDLEKMKKFYEKYFDAKTGEQYYNPKKEFTSYFLSFHDGCRLELMHRPGITINRNSPTEELIGIIHFAISVGTKEKVHTLTEIIRASGYQDVLNSLEK